MRGDDPQQGAVFSNLSPEERVPPEHAWRVMPAMVDAVLKDLRLCPCAPRVPSDTACRTAYQRALQRHPADAVSQRKRTYVEEIFGWMNTAGLLRKARHRGGARVGWMFTLAAGVFQQPAKG
jgi:hypothetical protein